MQNSQFIIHVNNQCVGVSISTSLWFFEVLPEVWYIWYDAVMYESWSHSDFAQSVSKSCLCLLWSYGLVLKICALLMWYEFVFPRTSGQRISLLLFLFWGTQESYQRIRSEASGWSFTICSRLLTMADAISFPLQPPLSSAQIEHNISS